MSNTHDKDKDSGEKRGNTPEPNRRRDTRTGSMNSQTSRSALEDSYSAAERGGDTKKQEVPTALIQNFCPVTLTVNVFFKQVCMTFILMGGASYIGYVG